MCDSPGERFCVVSIRSGAVTLHGTFASLAQAKPARTRIGRLGPGAGYLRWAAKMTTFCVCVEGHLH